VRCGKFYLSLKQENNNKNFNWQKTEGVMKNLIKTLVILCAFMPIFLFAKDIDCSECHGSDGEPAINMEVFSKSVHADNACTDCHLNVTKNFDDHPDNDVTASCSDCHEDVVDEHKGSLHKSLNCTDCHGDVHTLDADKSIVGNADMIMAMCSKCHGDEKSSKTDTDKNKPNKNQKLINHYKNSVHYLKKNKDGKIAATCVDCHTAHNIRKFDDKESTIYKPNLSSTCGKCHTEEAKEYDESVHADGVKKGWAESPSCTGCHNSHNIVMSDNANALTGKLLVAEKICLSCHEDERLIQRYDLENHIGSTYRDSYHSMANKMGSSKAATCTDCHTTHHIMKSSNINASTNGKHLVATCSQCHKGINEKFAFSYSHKSSLKAGNEINYYVKLGYIWLIILTIGGMFGHNFMIYFHHLVKAYRKHKKHKSITRMSKGLVFMHLGLQLTFATLVVTGFSLRFAHLDLFSFMPFSISEITRAWIHRIAGSGMGILFVLHFIRMAMGKQDRGVMVKMLPKPKDIRDAVDNIRYHLFMSDKFPRFGQTTYIEKAEYLALIWGTWVMIVTGLVLWFPEFTTQYLPGWSIKVAETVHFYEAILATLAIIVWHLFFTILHPEVYPLDFTFMDGQMPLDEIEHMRPEWYEELKANGKIDED